jgi:spore cortex formation protein SpoVR/YcgB (stage V sporulation)
MMTNSMILRFHPDLPGLVTDLKFIGYWDAEEYRAKLGNDLPDPSNYIDEDWNATERALVIAHLTQGKHWEGWLGQSSCRFGCSLTNGSTDITDHTYVWPQGFAHYVEAHGVKPSQEFIDHILGIQEQETI